MQNEDQKLINQAKAKLPDPESYPANYCAPHFFVEKKRILFKKVKVNGGFKWEFVEILPIVSYAKKHYDTLY